MKDLTGGEVYVKSKHAWMHGNTRKINPAISTTYASQSSPQQLNSRFAMIVHNLRFRANSCKEVMKI
jgi:hypothetical protein